MVRHEVDKHLQPNLMRTLHEVVKLLHAACRVISQVTAHTIIVRDGVRRTSLALQHMRVLFWNAIF